MLDNITLLEKYLNQIEQKLNNFELLEKSYTKEQLETARKLQVKIDQIHESGIVF